MGNSQKLIWTIKGDDKFTPAMQAMARNSTAIINRFKSASVSAANTMANSFKMVPNAILGVTHSVFNLRNAIVGALAAGGIYKLKEGLFSLVDQAADVEEMVSKFQAVFKDQSGSAEEFANAFGNSAKRSKYDLMQMMSTIQDTLVPLGFARDKAADLSKEITKLSVDIGSFNNIADTDVLRDLQSAMVGNHETVRKYGIVITEATLQQQLLNSKLWDGKGEADELAKVMARLQIITNNTKDAQGDAERTAMSYANQIRGLAAAKKDLYVATGSIFKDAIKESGIIAGLGEQYEKLKGWINDNKEIIKAFSKEALEKVAEWAGKAKDAFVGWAENQSMEDWLNTAGLGVDLLSASMKVLIELLKEAAKTWIPFMVEYHKYAAAKDLLEGNHEGVAKHYQSIGSLERLQESVKSDGLPNALNELIDAKDRWSNRGSSRQTWIDETYNRAQQEKAANNSSIWGKRFYPTVSSSKYTPPVEDNESFSPFVKPVNQRQNAYERSLKLYARSQKIGDFDFTSQHFQKNLPALAGLARQAVSLRDMSRAERQRALEYISSGAKNWKSESPEDRRAYVGSLRDMTNPYGKDEFRNTALIFKQESDKARKEELKAMNTLVGAIKDTKQFWQNIGDVAKKNLAMTGGH